MALFFFSSVTIDLSARNEYTRTRTLTAYSPAVVVSHQYSRYISSNKRETGASTLKQVRHEYTNPLIKEGNVTPGMVLLYCLYCPPDNPSSWGTRVGLSVLVARTKSFLFRTMSSDQCRVSPRSSSSIENRDVGAPCVIDMVRPYRFSNFGG